MVIIEQNPWQADSATVHSEVDLDILHEAPD